MPKMPDYSSLLKFLILEVILIEGQKDGTAGRAFALLTADLGLISGVLGFDGHNLSTVQGVSLEHLQGGPHPQIILIF